VHYETSVTTTADRQRLWAAVTDVEDWPRWSPSYRSVRRLDDGPLRVGSRARVEQPGLRPAVYEVSELVPGEEFTWTSSAPGARTVATHRIASDGPETRLTLGLELRGALAGVVRLLLGRKVRRYVDTEARGLTAAAEAALPPQA
jgi:uncharacterized membrane protein